MSGDMIHIENVCKTFGSNQVLNDVSFTVQKGEICGLEGRNGSGKTVLLKCILGLIPYDSGQIRIQNELINGNISRLPMGFLVDTPGILPSATAYRNLSIIAGINGKTDKSRLFQLLEKVGLDAHSRKKAGRFSLGMRQRLGLAMAFLDDAPLLILDEPLNGIDTEGSVTIKELIKQQAKDGKTVIITSHNHEDIVELCNKVIHL